MAINYTYVTFGTDVLSLIENGVNAGILDSDKAKLMTNKANALIAANTKKAAYNSTHKKAAASKVSDATREKADAIAAILTDTPMTGGEIADALGVDWTALQISNAVKYIDGVNTTKVKRERVDAKGCKKEGLYTAYYMG